MVWHENDSQKIKNGLKRRRRRNFGFQRCLSEVIGRQAGRTLCPFSKWRTAGTRCISLVVCRGALTSPHQHEQALLAKLVDSNYYCCISRSSYYKFGVKRCSFIEIEGKECGTGGHRNGGNIIKSITTRETRRESHSYKEGSEKRTWQKMHQLSTKRKKTIERKEGNKVGSSPATETPKILGGIDSSVYPRTRVFVWKIQPAPARPPD